MKNESVVKKEIKKTLGTNPNILLLTNPSGLGVVGNIEPFVAGAKSTIVRNPRYIAFGLGAKPGKKNGYGYPDFVGIKRIKITSDMVGKTVGVFFGIEVKAPKKNLKLEQLEKITVIRSLGGIAGVAHSAQEAEELLDV